MELEEVRELFCKQRTILPKKIILLSSNLTRDTWSACIDHIWLNNLLGSKLTTTIQFRVESKVGLKVRCKIVDMSPVKIMNHS